jgi:hypothetical protein
MQKYEPLLSHIQINVNSFDTLQQFDLLPNKLKNKL